MISILGVLLLCLDGEIGRHNGLKIRCPLGRAGSSPAPGIFFILIDYRIYLFMLFWSM